MGKIEQLKADLASISLDAKPLAEKSKAGTITEDESTRLDELVGRMNEVGDQLAKAINDDARADDVLKLYTQFNQPADGVKRVLHADTAADPDDKGPRRVKSIGKQFVDSDELKAYRNVKRGSSAPVKFKGMFPEYDRSGDGGDGQKALIYSGTGSASMLLPQVIPGIQRGLEAPLVMRDVLMNLNTTSDALTVVTEASFTNGAVEVAEATDIDEGAKPQSALTFSEASFPVQTIAHWVPITRQMLEDLPMMEGYVEQRLRTGLLRREDNQFLNGNGTAPNLRGILNTSGIQDLDNTATTGYFVVNPVLDDANSNGNINRIRRAKRVIQVTGDAVATFAVMNPVDKEMYDTITDADRNYLLGGPTRGFPDRLWGLQIVESENITAGTVLVGDGTAAAVVDRRDAQIYMTDSHSDFFVRNIFVMLAEERVALPVFRPGAFALVELADWT